MARSDRARPEALEPPLGFYPTPLHPLDRFSEALGGGVRVWVKRDDQTGLATGGNKVRKLELLVADAVRSGATALVTSGGRQSNHCRQTAAAAARLGLRCVLVLDDPVLPDPEYGGSGNVLLDGIVGAEVVAVHGGEHLDATVERVVADLASRGERPYPIPLGGSNALGAVGYVRCAEEVLAGPTGFSDVFLAASSGGTQAGLLVGLRRDGSPMRVRGISVADPAEAQRAKVLALADAAADLLGVAAALRPTRDDVLVDDRQIGAGYGRPTDAMLEALRLLARTEGVLLDPVYTGKAMAGLVRAVREPDGADLGSDVLFLHTGGQAALFAYRGTLAERA